MVIESKIKLTEDQDGAMSLVKKGKRHTLLYGGSRSGKTFLIVYVIVLRALLFKGSRHLIYRLRLKDAIQSIWLETLPKVIELIPGLSKLCEGNETRHVLTFKNGSEIWVAGVDDARNEDSVLGKEYATVYANEASQIPYLTRWKVQTRLAQKIPGCKAREFVDLNPTTRAHWTAKMWIDHVEPSTKEPLEYQDEYAFYQLNPEGNKINLDEFYLRSLASAPDSMRRRFYLGEYASDDGLLVFNFPAGAYYAGGAFDEWVRLVGPGNVRFTGGLDIGFNDADGFVIVAYAIGSLKRWLVYEYKMRRQGLTELAEAVKTGLKWADEKAQAIGMTNTTIRIYSDTGGGGAKMVYDLRTIHKLPVLPAYKRDKLAAIELLQDEVRSGNFMVPAQGAFALEAESIVWTKDPDTGDIIRQIDDTQFHPDVMDAVLYAMRSVWYATIDTLKKS